MSLHDLQKICRPWFIFFLVAALTHQVLEKAITFKVEFLDNYLDPFLFMPILLHLIVWEKRILFKKGYGYTLPVFHALIYFLIVSTVAEILFPSWNEKFTADWLDILSYGIGTLLFLFFFNIPYTEKR